MMSKDQQEPCAPPETEGNKTPSTLFNTTTKLGNNNSNYLDEQESVG